MADYFYYFGFLYLIDTIRMLVSIFIRPEKDALVVSLSSDTIDASSEELDRKVFSQPKKWVFTCIFGFLFFVWAILGYNNNLPEKYLFLALVLVITFSSAFYLSLGAVIAWKTMVKGMVYHEKNIENVKPIVLPLNKIVPMLELILVLLILIHHFVL